MGRDLRTQRLKFTLAYHGGHFHGWQIQSQGERTVQAEVQKALSILFQKEIIVHAAGRTDQGVHACGQVIHCDVPPTRLSVEEMVRALNAHLPPDVCVLKAERVGPRFHARYNALRKTYGYLIWNAAVRNVFTSGLAWFIPQSLNLRAMRDEGKGLIGRHNFRAFAAADPASPQRHQEDNTTRRIRALSLHQRGPWLVILVEGDGFLYKMVRSIVGTLVDVGRGHQPRGTCGRALKTRCRSLAGPTAPAQGLFLMGVRYRGEAKNSLDKKRMIDKIMFLNYLIRKDHEIKDFISSKRRHPKKNLCP